MKHFKLFGAKIVAFFHFKRANRRLALIIALLLSLVVVSTAYAVVTFESYTGPQWLGTGYQFTTNVTTWGAEDPQTRVCLRYSVDNGREDKVSCDCTMPACDPTTRLGQWVCTIPKNYGNATIRWEISAYHDSSCVSDEAFGFSGDFNTGPTSLALTSFTTENEKDPISTNSLILLVASIAGLILLVSGWRVIRKMHVA